MGFRGRRAIVVCIAATAAAVLGVAPASGLQSNNPPTTIQVYDTANAGPSTSVTYGKIFSSRNKCLDGRTMKFFATFPDKPDKLLDTGLTSDEGAFGMVSHTDDFEGSNGQYLKVTKSVRGVVTCRGASYGFLG